MSSPGAASNEAPASGAPPPRSRPETRSARLSTSGTGGDDAAADDAELSGADMPQL
ncbi:hypothetical protein FM112_00695 [Gulosibacter sp. 10]|nr:hypothetical protein FM112_00695 [Gulosibacter sp. 10]